MDFEELTYGARGCAVVVGGGREGNVSEICHFVLWLGHDMVEPFFQESPSSGQVGVFGRYQIYFCGHFVRLGDNLLRTEVGEKGTCGCHD